eukprot:gene26231-34319_t
MINDAGEAVWDALVLREASGEMRICVLVDPGTLGGEPRWLTLQFDTPVARAALATLDVVRDGGGTAQRSTRRCKQSGSSPFARSPAISPRPVPGRLARPVIRAETAPRSAATAANGCVVPSATTPSSSTAPPRHARAGSARSVPGKRHSALDGSQLGFTFEPPAPAQIPSLASTPSGPSKASTRSTAPSSAKSSPTPPCPCAPPPSAPPSPSTSTATDPSPPRPDPALDHGAAPDGAVLDAGLRRHPEKQHIARSGLAEVNLDEMPSRGLEQRLASTGLGPVRAIGGCRFGLRAVQRARALLARGDAAAGNRGKCRHGPAACGPFDHRCFPVIARSPFVRCSSKSGGGCDEAIQTSTGAFWIASPASARAARRRMPTHRLPKASLLRILLINPNTTSGVTDLVAAHVRAIAGDAASFVPVTGRFGARYISSRASAAIAAHAALDAYAEHAAGCDAIYLACFGDPGLLALREVADVPVVGMAEAACLEACRRGRRFAIVTGGALWAPMLTEFVATLGFADRLATVRAIAPTGVGICGDLTAGWRDGATGGSLRRLRHRRRRRTDSARCSHSGAVFRRCGNPCGDRRCGGAHYAQSSAADSRQHRPRRRIERTPTADSSDVIVYSAGVIGLS